jgi:hypothetical protein
MAVKSTAMVAAKVRPTRQSFAASRSEYKLPGDAGRVDSPLTVGGAIGGYPRGRSVRGYPRHARSLADRALRQRLLVCIATLVVALIVAIVALPGGLRPHRPQDRATDPSPLLDAAAQARNAAATWIARWVAANADVACDPLMCGVLLAHKLAPERLVQLSLAATDPLDAEIVVATLVIRKQFGPRLARVYAPAVLASFGSGTAQVQVRIVASGAAAYLRALRADVQARRQAGAALLQNPDIQARGQVAREIAAGDVDARLLANLVTLVHWGCPLAILGFAGRGPGASAGMPLLAADITPLLARRPDISLTAGKAEMARQVARILDFLEQQRTPLRPARIVRLVRPDGQIVVQVGFAAPAPFGVFDGDPAETTPISPLTYQK